MAARHRKATKKALANAARLVVCQECSQAASLVGGDKIYPHRRDLYGKRFWRCECGAYVGCHPGTEVALGTPCGPLTKAARIDAHAALDPLWRRKMARDGVPKHEARGAAYLWLAEQLGIAPEECHVGMMDADMARRVVEVCRPYSGAELPSGAPA